MNIETGFKVHQFCPLHFLGIGLPAVLVLWCLSLWINPAHAQEDMNEESLQADREFSQQLMDVQRQFPLVAKALKFHENLPRYCNVDAVCFRRVQDYCLGEALPPKYCLEQAQQACCVPLVLAPIEN